MVRTWCSRWEQTGRTCAIADKDNDPYNFGKPLDFSGRSHEAHLFSVQREIADRVGVAIRELSGQEYVDVYADAVKKLMASDSLTAEQAVNRLCAECP